MPRSSRKLDKSQTRGEYSTERLLDPGSGNAIYEKNIFDSSFPLPDSKHILGQTVQSNDDTFGKRAYSYPTIPSNYRRGVEAGIGLGLGNPKTKYHGVHRSSSGLTFRSADSTQRALNQLAQQKYEAMEKRRAGVLMICLVMIAYSVHHITSTGLLRGEDPLNLMKDESNDLMHNSDMIDNDNESGSSENGFQGNMAAITDMSNEKFVTTASDEQNIEAEELPPQEEIIEAGKEFLQPLRYFADTSTAQRKSDVNFFFHIPRSGGQTIKELSGKCLGKVLASEVGVREGHGQDATLQVLEINEAKYVNVDTTSIDGLQRAAVLGLTHAGLADMIASSYFEQAGMLFDLEHKGRAFTILRDPVERAVSMYYQRTQGENADLDPSISLEDYAQGNGIENNWITRFITGKMEGELTVEHLEQAREILARKFLIGFLDDGWETVERIMKYYQWQWEEDETKKFDQEDCIKDLLKDGSNVNDIGYEMPKKGTQAYALITWQTKFDSKLFDYARELYDIQTKEWGSKERKKELKKRKKEGN